MASKVTESKQSQPNFIVIYRFLIGYLVGILYFDYTNTNNTLMLTTFDPDTNNNQFNLNQDQRLIFFSPLFIHRDHCVEPILPNKEVNICCWDVMMLIIIGVISQSAGQLVSRLASGAPLASDSGERQLLTWARTIGRDLRPGTNVWVTIWHQVAPPGHMVSPMIRST